MILVLIHEHSNNTKSPVALGSKLQLLTNMEDFQIWIRVILLGHCGAELWNWMVNVCCLWNEQQVYLMWRCVYRASYCNVLMWRCVYRASYHNVLMWRCVYRASYYNVIMWRCVYRALYCSVLMWRCVYRASYCSVLMWRCVYRASYCIVLMWLVCTVHHIAVC